jgi:hypothetical protein
MKPTVSHLERLLAKIEAKVEAELAPPPDTRLARLLAGRCLSIIVHELREGESREKAFAELAARYPQNVAGKTVDDLNWSDDLVGAQEKALAEHIAAHPEHAGCTVKDFAWIIREIVSPKWRLENGRAVFPTIDTESEDDLRPLDERNDEANSNGGGERRSSADNGADPDLSALPAVSAGSPGGKERGLDGGPDHHRSGAVLSFADGLKERSRRLGRPWQYRRR